MENAEEVKVKSIRLTLPFDALLKKAIKKGVVDYNNGEEIALLRDLVKKYSVFKAGVMWKTEKFSGPYPGLEGKPEALNFKNAAYISFSAYNPGITSRPDSFTPVEKFISDEFISALRRFSSRLIREEAKEGKFDIIEMETSEPGIDCSRIGMEKTDGGGYLPYGAYVVASIWLKK